MKLPFQSNAAKAIYRQPAPTPVPKLQSAEIAAHYKAARIGGDFYDFLFTGESKLLFVMLDIAGKRETALHSAAIAQETFRAKGAELYTREVEDSDAVTRLVLEMNRAIIGAAGGICCAPAFLGCYDESIGVVTYINAGHTPGVLKDSRGTLSLEANGLPLGLFSHATHDAQYCVLTPGDALVLTSKGLVESKSAGKEFGISGVKQLLEQREFASADEICNALLNAIKQHEKQASFFGPSLGIPGLGSAEPNDITTVALMRNAVGRRAAAS